MKSVIVTPEHRLTITGDAPMPVIGDYNALVKISVCGFCNGTDPRIIRGEMPFAQSFPTMLGHEGCGTVVETGARVRHIKTGEKHIRLRGTNAPDNPYSLTHGLMAEYAVLTDYAAMKEDGLDAGGMPLVPARIPDDFSAADGSMMITLCECLSAVHNFGMGRGDDVLVFGAGPMGQALMRFMLILGVGSVTCADSDGDRLERLTRKVGAGIRTVNPEECDLSRALGGQKFTYAVDAVGESGVVYRAAQYLAPGGKLCCLGVLRRGDCVLDMSRLPNNISLHMLNFPYGKYETMDELVGYIRAGLVCAADFYSDTAPLECVNGVYAAVDTHKHFKTLLTLD